MLSIYCDGGARGNPGPAAAAFIVRDIWGKVLHQESHYLGRATNNQAEYQAVILALSWLNKNLVQSQANFFLDSQLVVNQLTDRYKTKDSQLRLKNLAIKMKVSQTRLKVNYFYISRSKNSDADQLVNRTLQNLGYIKPRKEGGN